MKIIAIGRNYAGHAKEMNSVVPSDPIFFMKPETALLRNNQPFYLPDFSKEIHYETEIVLRIGKVGKAISEKFALSHINGIGIGFDFTARDLQKKLKAKGLPWEAAKSFDYSAGISPEFLSPDSFADLKNISFSMKKNKETVQQGNTKDLIFPFEKIIAFISRFISLKTGDLIYTGTPEGIGKVTEGDILEAYIGNKLMLETEIK